MYKTIKQIYSHEALATNIPDTWNSGIPNSADVLPTALSSLWTDPGNGLYLLNVSTLARKFYFIYCWSFSFHWKAFDIFPLLSSSPSPPPRRPISPGHFLKKKVDSGLHNTQHIGTQHNDVHRNLKFESV